MKWSCVQNVDGHVNDARAHSSATFWEEGACAGGGTAVAGAQLAGREDGGLRGEQCARWRVRSAREAHARRTRREQVSLLYSRTINTINMSG